MRITERGQVTIPKKLRDKLGLTPKTEIDFVLNDGRLELVRCKGNRAKRISRLYGSHRLDRSTDELMKLLRS